MCKICKTCSQSNFGVTLKKTEERAARMVNGKITEYFEGSEEIQEEILINYCFTCSKEITKDDLIEMHICKICKSKVEQVNKNGVCTKCAEEVDKLSEASREDLILMLLKQNKKISSKSSKPSKLFEPAEENKIANENKISNENKEEKNKEKLVKSGKKSDTIKTAYKLTKNIDVSQVEIDSNEKVSSMRKRKSKSNDKINISKKENKDENKEVALISQENMDKATNDNKEKVKSVPIIKSVNNKSLDYVTDNVSSTIKDINDMVIALDIKEDIDIYNINTDIADKDVVYNTLMEIEDIMNNISSFN